MRSLLQNSILTVTGRSHSIMQIAHLRVSSSIGSALVEGPAPARELDEG